MGRCKMLTKKKRLQKLDQIHVEPHGKHRISNKKKESLKSFNPGEGSEVTNLKKCSRIENRLLIEVG